MAASVYQVDLADGISGPANEAAKALQRLQQRISADRAALTALEREMKALQKSSYVNIDTFKGLQKAIDQKKTAIEQGQSALVKLGQGQIGSAAASVNLRGRLSEVSRVAQALPSRLGGPIDRLSKLSQVMAGAVTPAVALRVGLAAMFAVLAVGVVMLTRYGIAHADARRSEALHLAQLTKYRVGQQALAGLQESIDRVSASVSIGREDVAKYGAELARSGLRGAALDDALSGTAITAAALGDKAGAAFANAAKGPGQTAASIHRLAETAKAKLGGVVQAQMLSLEVQTKKAQEGFVSLFSGLKIDGFLAALKKVRDQFNANNSAAGRAVKTLVAAFGQPLLDAITSALKGFKTFFVQALIGVYELLIAYELIGIAWDNTFGKSKTEGPLSAFFKSFQVGRVAVYILAAAFAVLAVNVIAATWPVLAIVAGLYLFASALQAIAQTSLAVGAEINRWWTDIGSKLVDGLISGIVEGWQKLKSKVAEVASELTDYVKRLFGISSPSKVFAGFGESLSDGLIGGMQSRWQSLQGDVARLADDVAGVFSAALEIGSPSKVFERLGADVSAGVAVGVSNAAPQAQRAVNDLVDVPTVPPIPNAAAAAQGTARNSQSVSVSIGAISITAPSTDAPALASSLRRELESVLEGLAFEIGVNPAGAQ